MTDKEEIGLENQTEPSGGGDWETPAEGESSDRRREEQELRRGLSSSGPKRNGGASRRILLLVLLLLVLGAAAYFYLGVPQPEPPSVPAVVKKQPIAVPQKTETAMVAEAPAAPEPVQESAPAGEKVVEKKMPVEEPAAAAPAEQGDVAESSPVSPAEDPAAAAPAGPYVVQAGAFLLKSNLEAAEKQVRQLGFEPRVSQGEKVVPMTRLRVGVLPAAEAEARLREIADMAPDAFLLKSGDEMVLYAASYYDLDQARKFADRLYEEGLRVVEVPAEVTVPLYLLSFGDFAELTAAREEAEKARQIGLDAYVDRI